jgi:hypothetical protein
MGHADVVTTMRYVHHVPQDDAADRLTEVFRSAEVPTFPPASGHARDTVRAKETQLDAKTGAGAGLFAMAPGGVEPPRTDSKSVALSAELRGHAEQRSGV